MINSTPNYISENAYNAYKAILEEHGTIEIQRMINQIEAEQSILTSPVVETLVQEIPPSLEQRFDLEKIEPETDIVEYFKIAKNIFETQLPAFKDERYKNFLVFWTASSMTSKWARSIISIKSNTPTINGTNSFTDRLAEVIGLPTFAHFSANTIVNKQIKEIQLKHPYITICTSLTEPSRDTKVEGFENAKLGNMVVVHTSTNEYSNNIHIAKFEDIFESETLPENEFLNELSGQVMKARYLLAEQHDKEETQKHLYTLIDQLKILRPSHIKFETYEAWTGVLALALLTNYKYYEQMMELMMEQTNSEPLEDKVKLAGALSKIVPKYENFLNEFKLDIEDKKIHTTVLRVLLKSIGYNINGMSEAFVDIGLPLKEHKGGIELEILKSKYQELPLEDKQFKKYINGLAI
ncbi:TPA: hypothetical protein MW165_003600 [Acinetobacter baumannii]|nr:hypothetical protein [Acinetobacter baumannii]